MTPVTQFVVFNLGSEKYGVEISQVREIIKPTQITRIPNARTSSRA